MYKLSHYRISRNLTADGTVSTGETFTNGLTEGGPLSRLGVEDGGRAELACESVLATCVKIQIQIKNN